MAASTKRLTEQDRVTAALELMEALSASPEGILAVDDACRAAGCSASNLDDIIELISTLADREGGARAIVVRDRCWVRSYGTATQMLPLRLSASEAAALDHVLDTLDIDEVVRGRIARALLPFGWREPTARLIATTTTYGTWYQLLAEAIRDGVRCRMSYRAHGDTTPRERLVDPLDIESSAAGAYLIAWDIERDEQRRYRLERIEAVTLTEDSVERHASCSTSIRESLARAGEVATISFDERGPIPVSSWAGVERIEPDPAHAGRLRAQVHVAARAWLFDQMLASCGTITIEGPDEMRGALCAYARDVLAEPRPSCA